MTNDQVFLEAMASSPEHHFMVLGAGFVTWRLWLRLPADRLTPEQVHAIESALVAAEAIPDSWQFARAALRDALDALASMDADAQAQAALARYATAIARLAPDVAALILAHVNGDRHDRAEFDDEAPWSYVIPDVVADVFPSSITPRIPQRV